MTTSAIDLGPVCRDATTERFFSATARREFPICRCADCGVVGGPQQTQCLSCESTELVWEEATGHAVIRSYIVNHRPSAPGETLSPIVVAIGELTEGPWWWAQVADVDPDTVVEGMRLVLDFAPSGDEMVPIFRPDAYGLTLPGKV